MMDNSRRDNRFIKNAKKVPGFVADVVKVGSAYLNRKAKQELNKKLQGRSIGQAIKDAAENTAAEAVQVSLKAKQSIKDTAENMAAGVAQVSKMANQTFEDEPEAKADTDNAKHIDLSEDALIAESAENTIQTDAEENNTTDESSESAENTYNADSAKDELADTSEIVVVNKRSGLLNSRVIIGVCAACVAGFFCIHGYFTTHFLNGTVINGVDVSGMSLSEAKTAITNSVESYELSVIDKNGHAQTLKSDDIGIKAQIGESFDDILKYRSGYWAVTAKIKKKNPDPGDSISFTYDKDKLESAVSQLDCIAKSGSNPPVDAQIKYSGDAFVIIESQLGDKIDRERLQKVVENAIEHGEAKVDLKAEKLYEMPSVESDDPVLLAKKASLDAVAGVNIELKFGNSTEKLTPETLTEWYKFDQSGKGELDSSHITEYVAALASRYDTISRPKLFVDHDGETIEIGNSYYGWQLDRDYAVQMIGDYISSKKSVSVDLTNRSEESDKWWLKVGVAYDDLGYYGNTYAEVSINSQHMWMYQNGEIVFQSDVVTGLPDSVHDTPVGIYSIIYKEKDATLKGDDYETKVAYWMVFTIDIGFHDADWQYAFGDDMYEYNGSHGCVNLPVDAAAELFDLVYPGMPVFVY